MLGVNVKAKGSYSSWKWGRGSSRVEGTVGPQSGDRGSKPCPCCRLSVGPGTSPPNGGLRFPHQNALSDNSAWPQREKIISMEYFAIFPKTVSHKSQSLPLLRHWDDSTCREVIFTLERASKLLITSHPLSCVSSQGQARDMQTVVLVSERFSISLEPSLCTCCFWENDSEFEVTSLL